MTDRELKRERAIATFMADATSRRIYQHFLSASMQAGPRGFDLREAENDPRFLLSASTVEAWKAHRKQFVALLVDALPDNVVHDEGPVRSILTGEAAVDESQTYVFRPKTLEEIPEPFRKSARVLPDGKGYLVTGGKDLLDALAGVIAADDPNNPPDPNAPPKPAPVVKPARGEFEISASEARDFGKYSALAQKARDAGRTVSIVD